jgi:Cu(I)/Ag(I) efflux system membrane protein CusA/SilA
VGMNVVGLGPVMLATGAGSDVMKRITSPMLGGLISLTLLTLVIIPVVYVSYRAFGLKHPPKHPKPDLNPAPDITAGVPIAIEAAS